MKLISNRDAFPRAVSGFVALWMTVTAVQLPTNEVIHSSYGHVIAIDCKILWQNSTSLSPTFCRKYNWVGSSAAPVSSRLICSVYGLLFCFCVFFGAADLTMRLSDESWPQVCSSVLPAVMDGWGRGGMSFSERGWRVEPGSTPSRQRASWRTKQAIRAAAHSEVVITRANERRYLSAH